MPTATEWLHDALCAGELNRQTLMERATQAGFTEKQIRNAREALNVETRRVGSGPSATTIWALPGQGTSGVVDAGLEGHECAAGDSPAAQAPAAMGAMYERDEGVNHEPAREPTLPGVPNAAPAASRAPAGIRRYTSRDIDTLAGDELRAYARSVGVVPRDCAGLTEDRLRQNIKLVIQQTYELLSE